MPRSSSDSDAVRGGGQLDRERQAVEPAADVRHHGRRVGSRARSCRAPRSRDRRTGSRPRPGRSPSGGSPVAGTASEPVRNTRSPGTPSGSRLVASRRSSGQARRRSSARRAQASTRCSQLSSTSSSSDSRTRSRMSSSRSLCGRSRTPSTWATALRTSWGSNTGARSTSQAPSAHPFDLRGGDLASPAGSFPTRPPRSASRAGRRRAAWRARRAPARARRSW